MARNRKHISSCQYCKHLFNSNRSDAKFCSSSCRLKFHKETKLGKGKTWHSVRPEYAQMAMDVKAISPDAYKTIEALLTGFGGLAAEYAIAAAYSAAMACIEALEVTNAKSL